MSCREEYSGHLEFDLGNLMASEQGPIDRERFVREPDAACLQLATQIAQSLVARLFQLPSQAAPVRTRTCIAPCIATFVHLTLLHWLSSGGRSTSASGLVLTQHGPP